MAGEAGGDYSAPAELAGRDAFKESEITTSWRKYDREKAVICRLPYLAITMFCLIVCHGNDETLKSI